MKVTWRPIPRLPALLVWGALLAALPFGIGQDRDGSLRFGPAAAWADDDLGDRIDDARDDREDDRDDREDDRDDRNDDDDDDNSGRGGGDDDDDNSGSDDNSGGDDGGGDDGGGDDNSGGGDDNSGPSGGGDDDSGGDDRPRTQSNDDSGGDNQRSRPSSRVNNITVQYPDGWIERIVNGKYELIDNLNRQVIIRNATQEDFDRMYALR